MLSAHAQAGLHHGIVGISGTAGRLKKVVALVE